MSSILRTCILLLTLCAAMLAHAAEPRWLRVSSDHFIVVTDADQKKAHEIAARFEQMRAVFADLLSRKKVHLGEPIEIIAIASPDRYSQLAPTVNGQPTKEPGIFFAGEDRIFILLNAADPDCWRAVEHPLAHYFLNFNYPPTQPWFDEGFAEYFSSLYFTAQKTEIGGDPELVWPTQTLGTTTKPGGEKPLAEILNQSNWIDLPDLLQMKSPASIGGETNRHTQFYAQSWMLIHYLVNKNKLSETGTYFGLVKLQKVPVPEAVQQAFGMSPQQLGIAVKDYFHSLKPLAASLELAQRANPPPVPQPVNESQLPFSIEDVSVTSNQLSLAEATALVDEMELRILERREQAMQELQKLASGGRSETAVADRALAWAHIQMGDTRQAFDELNDAMQINASDAWTRFELAQASYHSGERGARIQGLANMMESLHIVIDRYPGFAEAYNMLGWARLAGGGANAAMEAFKVAVQLAPRSELYQLRLAEAEMGAKKWDDSLAIFERLQASADPQIAASAKKDLHDLPYLKKFGIPPVEDAPAKEEPKASSDQSAKKAKLAKTKSETGSDDNEDSSSDDPEVTLRQTPAEPKIDRRPVQFLKAKLISVDCSEAPIAVLLVSKGSIALKLRTPDYKSLLVMGADKFSCDWRNVPVSVNYRADAKGGGDLVSVEVH